MNTKIRTLDTEVKGKFKTTKEAFEWIMKTAREFQIDMLNKDIVPKKSNSEQPPTPVIGDIFFTPAFVINKEGNKYYAFASLRDFEIIDDKGKIMCDVLYYFSGLFDEIGHLLKKPKPYWQRLDGKPIIEI